MTLRYLLTVTAIALVITGCASQSNTNYENATQSLLDHLPEDADHKQPGRQLDLMPQGRYLTLSGEVVDIPRATVIGEQDSDSYIPSRLIEDIEETDEPEPIRIRVIDGN